MKESEIHQAFCKWLDKAGFSYFHSRTDKRTTTRRGDPDFLICRGGNCLFIEVKVLGGKRSIDQTRRALELEATGNKVKLAFSLQECVKAVEDWYWTGW